MEQQQPQSQYSAPKLDIVTYLGPSKAKEKLKSEARSSASPQSEQQPQSSEQTSK